MNFLPKICAQQTELGLEMRNGEDRDKGKRGYMLIYRERQKREKRRKKEAFDTIYI